METSEIRTAVSAVERIRMHLYRIRNGTTDSFAKRVAEQAENSLDDALVELEKIS